MDDLKKKTRIIVALLCLSLIGNGVLGYLYVKNTQYYEQLKRDTDYTIEQLRSDARDSYDEGYDIGYDEGADAQRKSTQHNNEHDGNGYVSQSSDDNYDDDNITTTVYITDTGSKYHRYGCQYLRQSCHSISLSDAKSQGYEPCSVCF